MGAAYTVIFLHTQECRGGYTNPLHNPVWPPATDPDCTGFHREKAQRPFHSPRAAMGTLWRLYVALKDLAR